MSPYLQVRGSTPWLFRVYLPKEDIEAVDCHVTEWGFGEPDYQEGCTEEEKRQAEEKAIEEEVKKVEDQEFMGVEDAKYIAFGPDSVENEGTEMVVSIEMVKRARFVLSSYTFDGFEVYREGPDMDPDSATHGKKVVDRRPLPGWAEQEAPSTTYGAGADSKENLINAVNAI